MLEDQKQRDLAATVARMIHADQKADAARLINESLSIGLRVGDEPPEYLPVLQHYLHRLLNFGGQMEAAQILWTPTQFNPNPKSTQQVWELFETSDLGLIMGGASMSKSFSMGVKLMLEYARDPEFTSVRLIGPSADHLEQNLFSHIVSLHTTATIPLPGVSGSLFIGNSRRNQLGSIKGLVIPVGKVKKAGRIQGTKRKPRPSPHPIHGSLSRMFIFIDEIENVPGGLWSDIDNALSMTEAEGNDGFKVFGAYNPSNQTDEVAKRAEPEFGWENLDPEGHFKWVSRRGWNVLRLDGERSENVTEKRVIFPGLQTQHGLDKIASNAGGKDSPGYRTMGRGLYPDAAIKLTVISPSQLQHMRGEFIWQRKTIPVAAVDLALEGGASAVFTLGKWGEATGFKLARSLDYPDGQAVSFRSNQGRIITHPGLQVEQQFILPKGDTVKMANQIQELCQRSGVRPQWLTLDRTGNGAGVHDLLKSRWGQEVKGVNFYEGSTDTKIMVEDTLKCSEEYERVCSELWFAVRKWGEFRYLLLHPELDMTNLTQQLTQRLYKPVGKKSRVEPKKEYTSRGFPSPDDADSMTLIVHGVRMETKIEISADGKAYSASGEDDDEDWPGEETCRIDPSNRSDTLNDS